MTRLATVLDRQEPAAPATMADLHAYAQRAETLEQLGALFAASIARSGFTTHFCFEISAGGTIAPLFGDASALPIGAISANGPKSVASHAVRRGNLLLPVQSWHDSDLFVGLGGRRAPVESALRASLLGRAEVFATFGLALLERESDIPTGIGLGLAQRQCLAHLLMGRRDPEIAESLGLTPLAVRGHIDHAITLMGVQSRVEAVAFAARRGWLADLAREPETLFAPH